MKPLRKKLIEVALPLKAINKESAREKSLRHGHPSTLHLWWARRPLASCRAVLFSQLVDDPSAWPERFSTEEAQDAERERLFDLIRELVVWENSNNEEVLGAARQEIARSLAWERGEEPPVEASEVCDYLQEFGPCVYDPFCGAGSIPLEAQRLGLKAAGSDLNPVAVMISKALVEFPPSFVGRAPVHPDAQAHLGDEARGASRGLEGLAEDIRHYGRWIHEQAAKKIGHIYPDAELPEQHGGGSAKVIAWIWARTVASPDPSCMGAQIPLVKSFSLSTRKGNRAWVEPVVNKAERTYRFEVRTGSGKAPAPTVGRTAATCLLSGQAIPLSYVQEEARAGRLGVRLMAVVADAERGRTFVAPTDEHEQAALSVKADGYPVGEIDHWRSCTNCVVYGMTSFESLFSNRQLVALTTFSELVREAREQVVKDGLNAGWRLDGIRLADGGAELDAYADAVAVYLAFAVDRSANTLCTLARWTPDRQQTVTVFSRQALPMTWDFPEVNPFSGAAGDIEVSAKGVASGLAGAACIGQGRISQVDATDVEYPQRDTVLSTDPPYYDNIPYSNLSDYFYLWMRNSIRDLFPSIFSTVQVPKMGELVANQFRYGGRQEADEFFLSGMSAAIRSMTEQTGSSAPATIFYAFKQAEVRAEGIASTGWATFLESLIASGLSVVGTWPIRTEMATRQMAFGNNALASSIVLVCRKRPEEAESVSRGDFRRILRSELPEAIATLEKSSVAPVDLAQASIGPGMAIFSRYSGVLEADGTNMSVRSALQLINEVSDEARGEEEGVLDSDTRFAVTWFETYGYEVGEFGEADTLAKARNVSVEGVEEAGIIRSAAGKVRVLRRAELPEDWDPQTDERLTVWEAAQHLIKRLDEKGEGEASELLAQLGAGAEQARNLAYRLYSACERQGWADEAQAYNGLVLAWPELEKLAGEGVSSIADAPQAELFE